MTGRSLQAVAPAKVNLALVVGPRRPDGKHEVATVLQRVELADAVTVRPAPEVEVDGFAEDTIVRAALEALRTRSGVSFAATVEKRIPVAAGLGGGSSDAATALALANELLPDPLGPAALHEVAAGLGADVPFFLVDGAQLGRGDGSQLEPVAVPQSLWIVLALPAGAVKRSTADVYAAFDARAGEVGFAQRRARLLEALSSLSSPSDLATLPPNDLASSPLSERLLALGAVRADVSGAGPTVYGLFSDEASARAAAAALGDAARCWVTRPRWYR